MELQDLITVENIRIVRDPASDKMEFLHDLLDYCLKTSEQSKNKDQIWKTLIEREMSMSTGIGLGVAVPHCSSDHVRDVTISIAVIPDGIDFQAVDNEPVRIVVLLLLPKNKFEKHIKTLASIARMFNDRKFRDRILAAKSEKEVESILKSSAENSQ